MVNDFDDYIYQNRQAAYAHADKNTLRNADGKAVISKDDEWCKETVWDDLCKELNHD